MNTKIKNVTLLGVGIALFIVLSMCLRVPVFENYYICLGYVVMAVYMWCFKWYHGAFVGFFGVILYCIIGGLGVNGMPGWAVGNLILGLVMGVAFKFIKKLKSKMVQVIVTAIITVFATFVAIELVKSIIDSFVVSQPFAVRFVKNFTSFVADSFTLVASLPICLMLDKYIKDK